MPSLPRVLLHLEGAIVLAASVAFYARFGMGWGWFALLVLAPDVTFLAYLAGPRVGAYAYDAAHTYAGPALVAALAWAGLAPWGVALVWAAHLGADRMLGFGLKYPTAFKDTHLQRA